MFRLYTVARVFCLIGKVVLLAALVNWVAAAPLVWILRDGLGPGMIESAGMKAVFKFLIGWGIPALMIAAPLAGLLWIERRFQPAHTERLNDE